jgi:hypothetical protein
MALSRLIVSLTARNSENANSFEEGTAARLHSGNAGNFRKFPMFH